MKTLIIIPAFNESLNIYNTFVKLKPFLNENIDYLIINDGSSDDTLKIIQANNLNHLNNEKNIGLAKTMQKGFAYAYENNYEYAIQFDGDGQHDPQFINEFIMKANESRADIILGNRFFYEKKKNNLRHFGNTLICLAIKLITKTKIHDSTCGYRLYSKKMLKIFSCNNFFEVEPSTIAFLILNKMKILEINVVVLKRQFGTSHFTSFKAFKYMIKHLFKILFIIPFKKRNLKLLLNES